ncbi:hypothetical protein RB595_003171 [Gaeumannomyces hyphopodioides]
MTRTSSSCAWLLIATLLFLALAEAKPSFSFAAKTNVVVYYGQGPNQKDLLQYCKESSIDVIVLSFIHLFPAQANGLPGSNFGNQCRGAVYRGPGRDRRKDALQADCPRLRSQLAACQGRHGKKLLLSLGGGTAGYQLTGAAAGRALADQLWALFGPPGDPASRLPRPFGAADLDGFDLDIEHPPTDGGAGYRALAARLRAHFASPRGRRKPRYLTASPQCLVPDSNLSAVIRAVRFDALFIQFYNTQTCSAARWARSNPSFTPGSSRAPSAAGFTFDDWARHLRGTPSRGARLLVGLPGGARAAAPGQYVPPDAARRLVEAYYCRPQFAGVAVWDATYAAAAAASLPFYASAKSALARASADRRLRQCPPAPEPATASPPNTGACGMSHPKCPSPLCCSKHGYCGQSITYCGAGCQRAFGICS